TIQQNVLLLHSFWGPGAADALIGWMRLPVRFIGGLVVSGLGLAGLLLLVGASLMARRTAHPRRIGQEELLAAQSRD
ncbi:MAG TPA: hypothetical protein PL105_17505, partial [Caldilineaceae bacterium]|nr:hypothetical protein [Caldilineaceae bacterium]